MSRRKRLRDCEGFLLVEHSFASAYLLAYINWVAINRTVLAGAPARGTGSPDKVQIALKVLVCWMDGKTPSSEDIQLLRSLEPDLDRLPPDELACTVIKRCRLNQSTIPRGSFPPIPPLATTAA